MKKVIAVLVAFSMVTAFSAAAEDRKTVQPREPGDVEQPHDPLEDFVDPDLAGGDDGPAPLYNDPCMYAYDPVQNEVFDCGHIPYA